MSYDTQKIVSNQIARRALSDHSILRYMLLNGLMLPQVFNETIVSKIRRFSFFYTLKKPPFLEEKMASYDPRKNCICFNYKVLCSRLLVML